MPYVDLDSADDHVSIFYRTNTLYGNVGGFDPTKPTLVMLHPMFMDVTWLDNHFNDPRLHDNYNLIGFDQRISGRSTSRPTGKHDSWVDAADLAFCFQRLHLPCCHILALEAIAVYAALRFAFLFPEMCASLTLCNVPPPTELKWLFTAYDDISQAMSYATDLDSFEHSSLEGVKFVVGSHNPDLDLQDDLIEYFEININPRRRTRLIQLLNLLLNRTPLSPTVHKMIHQPILVLHGDKNEIAPQKYAEKLVSELTRAEGGAILYTVRGGSSHLSIIPGHASIANQVLCKFLSRLPRLRSDIVPPKMTIEERMSAALVKLAELMDDPTISTRDPLSSLSFCCLDPEAIKSQTDSILLYRKGEQEAFNPLGPDGRPLRKYTDKKQDHWFSSERDGLSYAGSFLQPKNYKHTSELSMSEKHLPMPTSTSEPISLEAVQQGRVRRATICPTRVDQLVIKGSMAKVVGAVPTTAMQRMII